MKKILSAFVLCALFATTAKAQTFTMNPVVQCASQFTTVANINVTGTVSGATQYSWTLLGSPGGYVQINNGNGTQATAVFLATGISTVVCSAYSGSTLLSSSSATLQVLPSPTISISSTSPQNICGVTTITLGASGANTYTWVPGSVTSNSMVVTPSVSTCYTVWGMNTNGCFSSVVYCVNVATASPVVSLSPSGSFSVCGGGTNIYASGASSYTWSNSSTGSSIYANSVGCYSVIGANGCGTATNVACITGTASPAPISIIGPTNICSGNSATLTVSNTTAYPTYTWYGPFGTQTGTSIVISPTANASYSVNGSGACNYWTSTYITVNNGIVSTSPSGTNLNLCSSNANITAFGASSYTWTGPTGTTIGTAVNATLVGCYTVTASSGTACPTSTAQVCVNSINTAPSPTIIASTQTVCSGSPISFTASGATTYSWAVYSGSIISGSGSTFSYAPNMQGATCVTLTAWNGGCVATAFNCFTIQSGGNLTVTSNPIICAGNAVVLNASGALTYSWSNGSNTSSIVVSPSVSTCYSVTGSVSGCGGGNTAAVSCVSVISTPTFVITGPATVCPGSVNAYSISGNANVYNWTSLTNTFSIGSGTLANINASQGCFMVYGYSSGGGCYTTNTICPVSAGSPTISIAASSTVICQGQTSNLVASGASSYTWSTSSTGAAVAVNPATSTCYTVIGSNSAGCTSSAVRCILVNPSPGGSTTNYSLCAGSSMVLQAAGAVTYSWSNGPTTASILVSPTANTCYTVTGTNSSGCSGSSVHCVSLQNGPSLSIAGPYTVCLGSSIDLVASGATSYSWNTGPVSYSINVLPATNTSYTVSSVGSNGCTGYAVANVTVNTNCSDVWPGDANSDGTVGSSDVLELGLQFSNTGAARSPGGNSYVAQYATNWTGTISTGKNRCHADCNGDGVVNNSDTLAIYNNFSMNHAFRPSPSASGGITLSSSDPYAYPGVWNKIDIMLGDGPSNPLQLYGVAFEIDYDNSQVENGEVFLSFTNSFLNNGGQNLNFRKPYYSNGKIYGVSVRTDKSDVNGNGKIAELWFKASTLLGDGENVAFNVNNVSQISAAGILNNLSGSQLGLDVSRNYVGISENKPALNISLYPNPSKDKTVLSGLNGEVYSYSVTDLSGRLILKGQFSGSHTLDVSTIDNGIYLVNFSNANGSIQKKLVVEHR